MGKPADAGGDLERLQGWLCQEAEPTQHRLDETGRQRRAANFDTAIRYLKLSVVKEGPDQFEHEQGVPSRPLDLVEQVGPRWSAHDPGNELDDGCLIQRAQDEAEGALGYELIEQSIELGSPRYRTNRADEHHRVGGQVPGQGPECQ